MGSSKKHKSEKKTRKSRSPSPSPEKKEKRKRHHKSSHRKKVREEATSQQHSSNESDVEVIDAPPPPKLSRGDSPLTADGQSHDSLSIEETNKLRAKLGLKPLQVGSETNAKVSTPEKEKKIVDGGVDMGEFVHKPPKNFAEIAQSEKIKERLTERKEKRKIDSKLATVKALGESDDEVDNTEEWVKKLRQKQLEKEQAEKRAKLLEELDEEFGVGQLVEDDFREEKRTMYTSRHLKGLKIGHDINNIEEEKDVVLTLADKNVLDEDMDELINVNLIDDERHRKNVERRTKLKNSTATMPEEEEDEFFAPKKILSKYDEEIEGEKKNSFVIGNEISEMEKTRLKLQMKSKMFENKQLVNMSQLGLRLASDYLTQEEISTKFKKMSSKGKKFRKKPKPLKATDLVPLEGVAGVSSDRGSRNKRPYGVTENGGGGRDGEESSLLEAPPPPAISKPEPMDVVFKADLLDVDDLPPPPDDLTDVKLEPDEAELELQMALNKARKLKQKDTQENPVVRIAKEIVESGGSGYNLEGPGGSIVLNSTAEFCRTLGDIPTYGQSGNREVDESELLDFEIELKREITREEHERHEKGAWSQIDSDEKVKEEPIVAPILDEEPDVGNGIAGALRLALSKGYLEKETLARPSASRFSHLQAQHYSIEDKAHGDDDKWGRRERHTGPSMEFKEKDNYKPNIKLEYIDDDGRMLNAKEAFRYLSHKFHGKGPGKNKIEKRMKKNEQEGVMKQMSSTDTPLNTLRMLQHRQRETKSAYIVLSGNKRANASAATATTNISKSKR